LHYVGAILGRDKRNRKATDVDGVEATDEDAPPLDKPDDLGLTATTLDDLNAAARPTESSTERYSAWADRLRDNRTRAQATIRGTETADETGEPGANWSAEAVLGDDDPVDDPGVAPDQMRVSRLLSELGLEADASCADAALAYRNQAKVHHPDRWVEADDTTQAHHAEEMLRLNAVWRALKSQLPPT